MAEKKGVGHAYNVDFLNVVFAASSIFLFLSVVWMVWDDYNRDWKKTQRHFSDLEVQVTQAQLQQATLDSHSAQRECRIGPAPQHQSDGRRERIDEGRIDREIVLRRMARAARPPVAIESLAQEDVGARADLLGDQPGQDARVLGARVAFIR